MVNKLRPETVKLFHKKYPNADCSKVCFWV